MAVKSPAVRSQQVQSINRRAEAGVFEWGGMAPDCDPAGLAANQFQLLINVRKSGFGYAGRGGSDRLVDLGSGEILGICDFQMATPRKLWVVVDGCPGLSSSVGFSVGFYDIEQNIPFTPAIYYSTATQGVVIGAFDDELYIGVDNVLRKIVLVEAPYGGTPLNVSGSSQDLPLLTFTGMTKINDLASFDGKLFVALDGGAGTSKISCWDGLTQSDDLASINAPTALAVFRESLVAGFSAAGPNSIRVRPVGVPGATWATVAPTGAGTAIMRGPGCAAAYKDVLWWATGAQTLCSYNGTTLTVVDVATTGIAANSVTHSCCVFNGYLFVSYTTSTNHACLARYDGTTWVPVHKDLTVAGTTAARGLAEYRGDLWIGATGAGGGRLWRSPGVSTTGTWVLVLPATANNGDVRQLLVY